jgi:sulfonate transport system substrate-binding protein
MTPSSDDRPMSRMPALRRRRIAAVLAALAASVAVAACGSSKSSSSSSTASSSAAASSSSTSASNAASSGTGKTVTLRIGDQAGTGAKALLQAAGLLNKLPFKVQWADFTSGPPILEAINSGSLDIGGVGNAPPVFAAAGGDKIAIVGAFANENKSAALLVPKGSPITSVSQLKGKSIAVAQGSSANYHILAVLNKAGISVKDVHLDYLQPAQGLAALESGSVAAWDIWSPFIEEAVIEKGAKILAGGTGIPGNDSYVVASKSAIANPTVAKEITEYLKLLYQAHNWANSHPDAWGKTWAAATGLPLSIMNKAAADDIQKPVPVNGTIEADEQGLVNVFAKAGLIPKQYSFAPYVSSAFNSAVQ